LQRDGAHAPPLNLVFILVPAQAFVGDFLQTFKEFPPRGGTKMKYEVRILGHERCTDDT